MSLIGSELETGGHRWRVTSVVREGPAWRILLRTPDGRSGTMTALTEGVSPPTNIGDLRGAVSRPESRTFLDDSGARWRAELIPHYDQGQAAGELMVLSAEMTSERVKVPYRSVAGLAVLSDSDLKKSLDIGRRAAAER